MHNLESIGEAVVLHAPFISLQSLPSPISIPQASADDSHQGVVTVKQGNGMLLSLCLSLSIQENTCMTNKALQRQELLV